MEKILKVGDIDFNFVFLPELKMWRVLDSGALIDGRKIDLEIDLNHFPGGEINWDKVNAFLTFIIQSRNRIHSLIESGERLLISFIKETWGSSLEELIQNIKFDPTGITVKYIKGESPFTHFYYDIFMFPADKRNMYNDLGSLVYRITALNHKIIGVSCDE
jgi:hypothetical protein